MCWTKLMFSMFFFARDLHFLLQEIYPSGIYNEKNVYEQWTVFVTFSKLPLNTSLFESVELLPDYICYNQHYAHDWSG